MWLRNNQVPLVLQHIPQSWATHSLPQGSRCEPESPGRGKQPQDCMATKEGESVNCDHHAELSDWVRWVQHSENQKMKGRLSMSTLLILPHLYLHLLTTNSIPPLQESGRLFFFLVTDYLTEMKNLERSSRTLTKADNSHPSRERLHIGFGHTTLKYKQIPNIYTHLRKPCYKKTGD